MIYFVINVNINVLLFICCFKIFFFFYAFVLAFLRTLFEVPVTWLVLGVYLDLDSTGGTYVSGFVTALTVMPESAVLGPLGPCFSRTRSMNSPPSPFFSSLAAAGPPVKCRLSVCTAL